MGNGMTEFDDLYKLAAELQALKKQAKALGMFTNDREFLECPSCGLKESVTFENTLYTYRDDAFDVDTGLRFTEPDEQGTIAIRY
jgi:hypothetical protein